VPSSSPDALDSITIVLDLADNRGGAFVRGRGFVVRVVVYLRI